MPIIIGMLAEKPSETKFKIYYGKKVILNHLVQFILIVGEF